MYGAIFTMYNNGAINSNPYAIVRISGPENNVQRTYENGLILTVKNTSVVLAYPTAYTHGLVLLGGSLSVSSITTSTT